MRKYLALVAVLPALVACGSGAATEAKPSPTATVETSEPSSVVESDYPVEEVTTEPAEPTLPPLPVGYPKVVKVSTLPDQVRNWYEMDGATEAVALAPGVWVEMMPGATMEDAVSTGVLDGWCSSIKAFERTYLDGQEAAGTCW